MTFQQSVRTVLTEKYATFSGRARRSEYWWFFLAYLIGAILLSLLGIAILQILYALALIVPLVAVGFRRLQDAGHPGWYYLIPVVLSLMTTFLVPASMAPGAGAGDGVGTAAMPDMPDMASDGGSMMLFGLLGFTQLVVFLIMLWMLTRPAQPGQNAYGPPPPKT